MKTILTDARSRKQRALSEYDSKRVIAAAGVPMPREELVASKDDALRAAAAIGYPVVLKGCADTLLHKTEKNMVFLNLASPDDVGDAYDRITGAGEPLDGVLVQEQVRGGRELVIGMVRDPQFGPCVMFGLGGVFTEVLRDTTFRVAPLSREDAAEMLDEVKARALLGEFRGQPAVDREALIDALVGIGALALENDEIAEIDINPIIVAGDRPVAVDAVVVLRRE
ncbi:MAG TPA: acetate--CoA ligase family protein [Spirochaetota bacterium]|nr:acetate--CoA ligase family protein [Spirochaetota bacterium]HPU89704.1 acetate--CoA ligase family protein [Spirochaetota bacterium]